MLDRIGQIWPGVPTSRADLFRVVGDALTDVGRLTVVTVLAYLLTVTFISGPVDLTGALTAMLVTQASLRGSFRTGLTRVAAVLIGVGVAVGFSLFVGLQWWSLGLAVFVALMVARIFQLGASGLETAISAMLILGSSGTEVAAVSRLLTTLIGTVVGVIFPLALPRRIRVHELSGEVRQVAIRLGELFDDAGDHLATHTMTRDAATQWLASSREVVPLVTRAAESLDEASELRRWNRRAIFQADVVPLLREGLDALERTLLAARQVFRVMQAEAPLHPSPDDGYGDQVRRIFSVVLREVGLTVAEFGALLEAEAGGDVRDARVRYEATVATLRDTRARLTDLMLVDSVQTDLWMMRGSILSAIDQMLQDLDATAHARRYDEWQATQLGLALPQGSVGPRIRTPWGLAAHQRMRRRAARSRTEHPEVIYEVSDDELTVAMPAVEPVDEEAIGEDPEPR